MNYDVCVIGGGSGGGVPLDPQNPVNQGALTTASPLPKEPSQQSWDADGFWGHCQQCDDQLECVE